MTPKLDKLSLQEDYAGTPNKLDEIQKKSLAQLRQAITADPAILAAQKLWCDDWCLCRYLRARNWDVVKVSHLFQNLDASIN